MKEVLTAEAARYQEWLEEVCLTREDVTMLEILEAKLEREGWEKGLQEGLKAGTRRRTPGRARGRTAPGTDCKPRRHAGTEPLLGNRRGAHRD